MATTAEAYGFGARAPYAQPRASDYEMKERVRLSGLFPRVRNEPMSNQLQALLKEFENNAALTGILERRRRFEERLQFELKGTEGMDALRRNLAPPFRAGLAGAAVNADVADRLARSQVPGQLAPAARARAATADKDTQTKRRPIDLTVGEEPISDELTIAAVTPRRRRGRSSSVASTPGQSRTASLARSSFWRGQE